MRKVLDLTNEMCRTLIDVERAGIKIDVEALDHLETAYRQEFAALERELNELASKALGDTPFKLSSNDDLSMLIFSRKPKNKKKWASVFNLGTEVIRNQRKKKQPVRLTKKQ